jgi:D-glycero-alpha-D-manno-heptose-7-phosphate kinase
VPYTVVARAPARIDFGGGWTDVPPYGEEIGGFVCNLAITRYAVVLLRDDSAFTAPHDDLIGAAMRSARLDGVGVHLTTDFPPGAGLGGSSAVGVALQAAISAWRDESVDRETLARRSRGIEVHELGIAGGWQDHYAAAFGGALGLTFTDDIAVRSVPMSEEIATALERRCVVAYTGQSRISGATISAVLDAYRARVPDVMHALASMAALARAMADAITTAALDDLGELVGEHWTHQRALHHRITTPEIERTLGAARAAGALGGKALGASGGGCVLAITRAGREHEVREAMARVATLVPFGVDRGGVQVERRPQGAVA